MERWVLMNKKADFYEIGRKYGIDPVLARLIRNRDIIDENEIEQYLYGDIESIPHPGSLKDIDKAADILIRKIREGKRIRIISDYDVDGVTANYILYKGLESCGALIDYKIPDRILDGYGINEHLILQAYEDGIDTILTCDNGIAAYNQIKYGKQLGMTIVVTDHHDVPYEETEYGKVHILPPADAVVNPKREDCNYPHKNICGAVVALKLIIYIFELMKKPKNAWHEFLEFAAIATVCDVMNLIGENRILVKEGLKRLNQTSHIGLQALIRATGMEGKQISSYHLGFVIGPCINASGRLKSAEIALTLLLCQDRKRALELAIQLKELNEERKEMTFDGLEQAIDVIEKSELKNDKILIVYLSDCHESLAGIIAGRIREKYNKPVIVLTDSEEGALKGSGRSIEAYSMFEELSRVKSLMTKFGGHPMAAGLTLPKENLEIFKRELNRLTTLTDNDFIPKVSIDIAMPVSYISENLVEQLKLLEPFGCGNSKPLFAQKKMAVKSARILGVNRNVLKMRLADEQGYEIDGIYFGNINDFTQYVSSQFGENEVEYMYQGRKNSVSLSFTYYPDVNEYRGMKTLQIVIQNYK